MKPEQPDAPVHRRRFLRRQGLLKALEQGGQVRVVLIGGRNAAQKRKANGERQPAQPFSPAAP